MAAHAAAQPISVFYVHSSDELYGSDRVLLELARRLDRRRFRPLVALPDDLPYGEGQPRLSDALQATGIPVWHAPYAVLRRRYLKPTAFLPWLVRSWRGGRQLERLIATQSAQVVHVNTIAAIGGALAAKRLGLPVVWHVHEIIERPAWFRQLISILVPQLADRVVAISDAVAVHLGQEARARLGERLVVIPNAIDAGRFTATQAQDGMILRREWGIDEEVCLIGVVGRLHTWKGHLVAVESARLLRDTHPQLRFVFVGDVVPGAPGPRIAIEQAIQAHRLVDRVRLVGYCDRIPAVMAAVDVLVLPSTSPEPFGMVLLEAMAAGKPVIATAHGGPTQIVVDGETGILVPPGDPVALANAVSDLAGDATLRARMGAAGRRRVLSTFSFDRHVDAFEALYEELARD